MIENSKRINNNIITDNKPKECFQNARKND